MTPAGGSSASLPEPVAAFLRAHGLIGTGAAPAAQALTGGVSSDIWRVETPCGPICVKRALARLKVAALWEAPVERNFFERRWMQTANRIVPGLAPDVLAADDAGVFAMAYLDPARHPLWKTELRDGRTDPAFAALLGERLARIHSQTAGRADIAAEFATDESFHAIRIEPYLHATARAHRDCAPALEALAQRTAATRLALVHGDVSPKNILVGPEGPILLDAECAWYGDPAFDLAFCLNHLLLKCLWTPRACTGFLACYDALAQSYCTGVAWEPGEVLEARVASLLPGLLLARIDGKSPVEYLERDTDRNRVRRVARSLLIAPPSRLAQVRAAWLKEISE